MYYRHDGNYLLIEKSETLLTGENVLLSNEDFDLKLYDVIVAYITDDIILRHTKIMRRVDNIVRILNEQAEYFIDLDFRLCMIELGLTI